MSIMPIMGAGRTSSSGTSYSGDGMPRWKLLLILLVILVVGFIAIGIALYQDIEKQRTGQVTYRTVEIEGMPCVIYDNGISCDWSRYRGE